MQRERAKMVYALKHKKYFQFHCVAKTETEFEEKIEKAYWSWRASRGRGALEDTKSKEVFLEDYYRVTVTINKKL
jgi:hypothetical protein